MKGIEEIIKTELKRAYTSPDYKFCYFTAKGKSTNLMEPKISARDWMPQLTVNVKPYYWNTHTIALAFGCEKMYTSEGKEWIKPLGKNLSLINSIRIPDVNSGRTGEIIDIMKRLLDEYPEQHLIRLPDIQSPLGVAELIMGDFLYYALLTEQRIVHELLQRITEFIIIYINEIRSILKSRYNPACHPMIWSDPEGYYISDDANSMVSPEMHEEFSVDYINKITAELGPVFYHTCTYTRAYLENIRKIQNMKLLNWSIGTSMDPAIIIRENSGKVLMAPHVGAGMHREEGLIKSGLDFKDESELVQYFLDSMLDNSTLYMCFEESFIEKEEVYKKIYSIMDKHHFTPEYKI